MASSQRVRFTGVRNNKIPILVSAAGGKLIRLFRLDNQIRRPHLPAFCKFRGGRQIGRRAFDGTLFHPMSDRSDLCVGESKLIRKFKFAGIGQPRRHESALRNGDDLPGINIRILIGEQREGAGFAGAMARGAMLKTIPEQYPC